MRDTDKDTDKTVEDIVEETMREIYSDINDSDYFDAEDSDEDIEFLDIDLDKGFTDSSHKYFDRGVISEDDFEEDFEEEKGAEESPEKRGSEKEIFEDDSEEDFEEEDTEDNSEDDFEEENSEDDSEDDFEEEDSEDDSEDESEEEDSEEDFEDDFEEEEEESEAQRAYRRHKRRKMAAIISGSIVGVLAAVYLGFSFYFGSHLLFRTTINGTDFSTKTAGEVEEYMKGQVNDYILTIEESDGDSEQIAGSDIALEYVPGKEINNLIKKQNNFFWIESLWKKTEIETPIGVEYDEKALAEELAKLPCLDEENQVKSIDAHPEFKDKEFVVVPEVIGTQIDEEEFNSVVKTAVNGFQSTVKLQDTDCYIKPKYLKDSKDVVAAKDKMNSYLGANVTYDFNPYTEVVDASVISQWITVSKKMKVTFSKKAVKKYIASLAEKYDTIEKTREFTTANGNVVSVQPGTYGWEIDQDTEYKSLISDIKKAETVTREPAYFSTAAVHETMDMGNTYAEVDLTAQHMWLFQNGEVTLDSDVVTGNPNIWNRETPSGVYSILEMQRNATLVGERNPKTGKPEYRTPVSFWMRVTWSGIGFHDATWQPYFGGSLYLSNGSHGCINMPYDQAEALFNLLEVGTPVVIHY